MANELLVFEDRTAGLAMNLDERQIGVVVLGDFAGIDEGQTVRRTGEVLSVPVGDGYLGRVVDPLGRPIDGLGRALSESSSMISFTEYPMLLYSIKTASGKEALINNTGTFQALRILSKTKIFACVNSS